MVLADEFENDMNISYSSAAGERESESECISSMYRFHLSELIGASVETVIGMFRGVKVAFAAFKTFMPCKSKPQAMKGVGSSQSEDRRQDQKASTASRAPPPLKGSARRMPKAKGRKKDLREVFQSNRSERSRIQEAS